MSRAIKCIQHAVKIGVEAKQLKKTRLMHRNLVELFDSSDDITRAFLTSYISALHSDMMSSNHNNLSLKELYDHQIKT